MKNLFRPEDAKAAARRADDGVYAVLAAHRGGELGYYAPVGRDDQSPHDRDEIYVIRSGHGRFDLDGEHCPFGPGDALFVPAGVPHRFAEFSADFAAWVIFFPPQSLVAGRGDSGQV